LGLFRFLCHLGHSTDDGFITYRYARNLAHGHGLVFNPGEVWLGTSAPGWAIVLGALGRIAGSALIPWLSGLLGAVCGSVVCIRLAASLGPRGLRAQSAMAATAVLASSRWLLEVLGHEGFAVAAAALAALLATERGRPKTAGALWAIAAWLRPSRSSASTARPRLRSSRHQAIQASGVAGRASSIDVPRAKASISANVAAARGGS